MIKRVHGQLPIVHAHSLRLLPSALWFCSANLPQVAMNQRDQSLLPQLPSLATAADLTVHPDGGLGRKTESTDNTIDTTHRPQQGNEPVCVTSYGSCTSQ